MSKVILFIFQIFLVSFICLSNGNEKILKISIGSDNFKDLLTTSDVFVDKSLFIKEVIESGDKATLITRPRRWGKSLALDMLKTFLTIESNSDKRKANRDLFENLKIAKVDNGHYMKFQGKYPVIHITLKDVTGDTLEQVESQLRLKISDLFKEHAYLLDSEKLKQNPDDIVSFRMLSYNRGRNASMAEIIDSLYFLSRLLFELYEKKVYILVDEYDRALNNLIEYDLTDNKLIIHEVSSLITNLLSKAGKSNNYLEKIILTGIFDSLKKEGGSGFNNVKIYSVLDSDYEGSFGFSEDEVQALVSRFSFDNPEAVLAGIKEWYNGYSVPVNNRLVVKLYTPWAVMNHLSELNKNGESTPPQSYWVRSGASAIFQRLLKNEECANTPLTESLLKMIESGSVTLRHNRVVSLFKYDLNTASEDEKIFSYLLLNSGYLTAIELGYDRIVLSIPNYEVKEELKDVFESHVKTVKSKKGDVCLKIQNAFKMHHSQDVRLSFIKNIVEKNVDILKQMDLEVKCDDSSYSIGPMHLAALSGDSDLFKTVAEKCKREGFSEGSGLSLADYAYLSSNQELLNYVKGAYGSTQSMAIPDTLENISCAVRDNVIPLATSAATLSIIQKAINYFEPQNFIKKYASALYNFVLNIPIFGRFGIVWMPVRAAYVAPIPLAAIAYKTYPYWLGRGCDNYAAYGRSDLSFPEKYGLPEFLKYRVLNANSSYVLLNRVCKDRDKEVSKISIRPLQSSEKLKLRLCHSD
ncbi:MAG: AAA family ATPase [Myxococcaceae bacterium]|nr:AAA family ATPase [Myxococcaceae bacterium]MBH2006552.1 AAA family ATPase [Myxococcaceae bacterium]